MRSARHARAGSLRDVGGEGSPCGRYSPPPQSVRNVTPRPCGECCLRCMPDQAPIGGYHGSTRPKGERAGSRLAAAPFSRRRRAVTGDVLVDSAFVRAEIAAPRLDRVALLVRRREDVTALLHVGGTAVLVSGCLARVDALNRVAPIRPRAEGDVAERRDPQVVAAERQL